MYLDFYQFTKAPFLITPDPEFLFLSPSHQEALGAVAYGIENRQGFVMIVGEVGVGKTTILHAYLQRVDPQLQIIVVLNSHITFTELLTIISRACDIKADTNDTSAWLDHFQRFLLAQLQQRRNVVLIIDEAQGLPLDTLNQLPLLVNLGTPTERPLQIVLAGQPELKTKLQREDLQHVGQAILIRAVILPLTREESQLYIYHRLAKVTAQPEEVFTPAALQHLVRHAKGVPRVLNILCTNALIAGYGLQQKPIGPSLIKKILADLFGKRSLPGLRLGLAGAAGVALVGSVFWLYTMRDGTLQRHDKPLPAASALLAAPRPPDTSLNESARQVPPAPRATTPPGPQPLSMDMPQKHTSPGVAESGTATGPDGAVEPDEQRSLQQPSAGHGGARHHAVVPHEQDQNPSERRPRMAVAPEVSSEHTTVPASRAQTTARTIATSRYSKRVVHVNKMRVRKEREVQQYDSRGISSLSPYSRGDDTGSSW